MQRAREVRSLRVGQAVSLAISAAISQNIRFECVKPYQHFSRRIGDSIGQHLQTVEVRSEMKGA